MFNLTVFRNSVNLKRGEALPETLTHIRGARGERVSFQLAFSTDTPRDAALTVECTAEGMPVSCETRLYIETFAPIETPTCPPMTSGEYADGLLPYERAVQLGLMRLECNVTYAALVMVDVKETMNVRIILSAGEESIYTDVKVIPYTFDMPKENHSRTCYMIWRDNHCLLGTELEQEKDYAVLYDMLLDFRISPYLLPNAWKGVEEFVTAAKKATLDDRVACYSVTYKTLREDTVYEKNEEVIDIGYLRRLLCAMAEASTDDCNLFRKAYIHVTFIDEPKPDGYHRVRRCHDEIYNLKREIADRYDFTGRRTVEASLLTMDDIVTAWCNEKLYGYVDTFCGFYDGWFMAEYRYECKKTEELGAKHWWYGCNAPTHPFANHHTDCPVIESRIEPWQRYNEGVRGDLYWSVNSHHAYDEKTGTYIKDMLDDPRPWPELGVNGEGLLIYYGTRYGDPFPTLRLNALCEGQKDYEYLLLYNNLAEKLCFAYEAEFTPRDTLADLFATLFDHTMTTCDAQKLDAARDEIAARIEVAEHGVLAFCNEQTLYVFAPVGVEVTCDGDAVKGVSAGMGMRYAFRTTHSRATVRYLDAAGKYVLNLTVPVVYAVKIEKIDLGSPVFPPYVARYWRNMEIEPAWRSVPATDAPPVRASVYREGLLLDVPPFVNTVPPTLHIPCKFDFSAITHICVSAFTLTGEPCLLQINLLDGKGIRYEVGYEVVGNRSVRYAVNRLCEKRLNTLYDYVSTWQPSVYARHQEKTRRFEWKDVCYLELVVLNNVKLLDDHRERRTDGYKLYLKNLSLESIEEKPS